MGLLDFFRGGKALTGSPEIVEALQERRLNLLPSLGGSNNQQIEAAFQRGLDASYGWIYRTQPAVRSVVDYIARNAAQLPLKLYERVDDTERERREDHPAAQTLRRPYEKTTPTAFRFQLFADYLVYENAYVAKFRTEGVETLTLVRISPETVTVFGGRFTPELYRIWRIDGSFLDVTPENMLHWRGYNPQDPLLGLSKLETLRQELAGDAAVQAAAAELAKNGLRGGHIERPLDAPEWSPEAMKRWQEEWRNRKRTREEPVLEEGMKYIQDSITPKDAQLLEAREFTKSEVAELYGLPLSALGHGSDTAEARKLVYTDVLPPITCSLAETLDVDLLEGEYDESDLYFEFDLNAKLQGDHETRFAAFTAAAGAPWITRNEVRAKENLPPIENGDELILPLNVIEEGPNSPALPAPNVMPMQDPNKPPQDGSYREEPKTLPGGFKVFDETHGWPIMDGEHRAKALQTSTVPHRHASMARQRRAIDKATALVERLYARQAKSLKSKSEKAAADTERWNTEFAKDIERELRAIVELEGGITVSRLGGVDFDMRQVEHYLRAMAEGTAEGINGATQRDIEAMGVSDAFSRAREDRAAVAGVSIGTRATYFARKEAAKQVSGPRVQTWIADTDRHAELDGVSVPLDSDWGGITPGSEPNCACSAEVN